MDRLGHRAPQGRGFGLPDARLPVRRVCDDHLIVADRAQDRGLAMMLRAFGVAEQAITRALGRGGSAAAIAELVPARGAADRTVTAAKIAADDGLPVAQLAELMEAFGLPMPAADEPAFTPAEAEALRGVWQYRDVWPFELTVQLGRLYGRLLARIAHASLQLWLSVVEPALEESHPDEDVRAMKAAEAFDGLLPLSDVVITGVYRRWMEREVVQMTARGVELSSGTGAVEVSFLFCDVKDFTAFADREGDGAAIRIIDRFAHVVRCEQGPEARLTKLLGDGVMLAYPDPRTAVEAGIRIVAGVRAPDQPGVHASVHHGLAIPREGDYFGSSVNLAARLLGAAGRDQLVATQPVVDACPEYDWERAGAHRIRGVEADVEVYKLEV
jgi:adenylate cyclase